MERTAGESLAKGICSRFQLSIAVVVALTVVLLTPTAYSADNFAVKDAGGETLFTVTDTGFVGVGMAIPRYMVDVTTAGQVKSSIHFSLNGTDVGGWITSLSDNNFWLSSGAAYDGAAGGWIQKSSDGKAVMTGSGGMGYRIFTAQNSAVGSAISTIPRLHVDYNGNVGINTTAVGGLAITTGSGAYLSLGGVWTNASSRKLKENIKNLSTEEALRTLMDLNPVKYNYKAMADEKHVGFIAEDVPDLVATKDRKGLSPMDIVAVLTKVVQEQKQTIEAQQKDFADLTAAVEQLKAEIQKIEGRNVTARIGE